MSVLIKDMKMPHDCDECRLCAFIPVGDYGINRKCLPLNAKAEITIRRVDCPLVEIQPHGRLIDADEIDNERIYRESYERDGSFSLIYTKDEFPTIIPADKDGES